MDEKVIIKGKFSKNIIPLIICACAAFIIIVCTVKQVIEVKDSIWRSDYEKENYTFFGALSDIICFNGYGTSSLVFYIMVLGIAASLIIFFMTKSGELTITATRVVGKASFGRTVDLPIGQISAIGLGLLSSIVIGTSSGRICFWLLENRAEVHDELSKLIGTLQSQETAKAEQVSSKTTSVPDELKKFKELLDQGIITQEEFDAKKKELLGL